MLRVQYKQIDGLRFLAVSAVVFHHVCPSLISKFFPLGAFGVNLFFVISGFLITEILIKEKLHTISNATIIKTFFIRRVLRIFPLYYLYVLICYLLVPEFFEEYKIWLLTYTLNFWIALKNTLAFWYFTHLWSLALEEQFYIFWPFLIVFVPIKIMSRLFIIMVFIAIVIRGLNAHYMVGYELFNYTMLPTALDCFGIGSILAYLKEFRPQKLQAVLKHKHIILSGIILSIFTFHYGLPLFQQMTGRFLNALVSFYLVGIATTISFKGITKRVLENKALMYFGKISYGIYIYHLLIIGSFGIYFNSFWDTLTLNGYQNEILLKQLFEFFYALILTIIAATLSFELIEKRFLNLRKYFEYRIV